MQISHLITLEYCFKIKYVGQITLVLSFYACEVVENGR